MTGLEARNVPPLWREPRTLVKRGLRSEMSAGDRGKLLRRGRVVLTYIVMKRIVLVQVLVAVLLSSVGLGWAQEASAPQEPGSAGTPLAQDVSRPVGYRIGPGDVIQVTAFHHNEISGSFTVDQDGTITYPFLGKVPVEGLTEGEVAGKLTTALEKDYYVDVQIEVVVKQFGSLPVVILGAVKKPGTYYLKGVTTLTQLLAEAGGFTNDAGQTIELRRNEKNKIGGALSVIHIPRKELVNGQMDDVILKGGDIIAVRRRAIFFVTGEVNSPGQYNLSPGETLMAAISEAGGLGKFGSQEVEIRRKIEGKSTTLTFNLKKIRHGKQEDPPIQADDVIFVKRRFF